MYSSILAGTDGSATAAIAVDRAAQIAAATGARLTLVCAGRADKANKVLGKEAKRIAAVAPGVETVARDGDPTDVLVDMADSGDYDLVVVGNKGMTGASRFLTGSVPNRVSHHLSRSLLIVRTT